MGKAIQFIFTRNDHNALIASLFGVDVRIKDGGPIVLTMGQQFAPDIRAGIEALLRAVG